MQHGGGPQGAGARRLHPHHSHQAAAGHDTWRMTTTAIFLTLKTLHSSAGASPARPAAAYDPFDDPFASPQQPVSEDPFAGLPVCRSVWSC